ncbi:MAG: glycosyltransferase family 2 protein [Coriobacteriales bacterium]|nr:glycosyltransferase family 2 protein [Coriobacteriales bacterium]
MPLLSVVVPCHNEEESLPVFAQALSSVARDMRKSQPSLRFELVLIDDGSTDNTLKVMRSLERNAPEELEVRWTSFSRNFGKEAGIYAGLKMARGAFVTTMDADMQDPPTLLPEMYRILAEDKTYDCVGTRRSTRAGEPPIRSFFARCFYRLINRISDVEFVNGARDFRLMRRRMVDAVLSLGEYNRFSKGIFSWVGFETYWLEYENVERVAGRTNWSFWSLFKYSLDGIMGFSTAPLAFASVLGAILSVVAFVFLIVVVVRALIHGDPVAGWPSTMSVILLLGGINLLVLGIIGQYLAKTYLETKARPLFVVRASSDDVRNAADKRARSARRPHPDKHPHSGARPLREDSAHETDE